MHTSTSAPSSRHASLQSERPPLLRLLKRLCLLQDFTKLDTSLHLDSLPAPEIRGSFGEVECQHLH